MFDFINQHNSDLSVQVTKFLFLCLVLVVNVAVSFCVYSLSINLSVKNEAFLLKPFSLLYVRLVSDDFSFDESFKCCRWVTRFSLEILECVCWFCVNSKVKITASGISWSFEDLLLDKSRPTDLVPSGAGLFIFGNRYRCGVRVFMFWGVDTLCISVDVFIFVHFMWLFMYSIGCVISVWFLVLL